MKKTVKLAFVCVFAFCLLTCVVACANINNAIVFTDTNGDTWVHETDDNGEMVTDTDGKPVTLPADSEGNPITTEGSDTTSETTTDENTTEGTGGISNDGANTEGGYGELHPAN